MKKPAPIKPCLRWAIVSRYGFVIEVFEHATSRIEADFRLHAFREQTTVPQYWRIARVRVCDAKGVSK